MHNPYSSPTAKVDDVPPSGQFGPATFVVHAPRSVAAGRGAAWCSEGFGFFKKNPGAWVLTCIVGFIVILAFSIIPLINLGASLLTYVWLGGILMGCKAQYDGEPFKVSYLFAGFKHQTGKLVLLGVIMLVLPTLVMFAVLGTAYFQLLGVGGTPQDAIAAMGATFVLVRFLIAMVLFIPLMMAVWFAPALICLGDLSLSDALQLSFKASLKNIVPMLLYGMVGLILIFLGSLPLGLGLLVVIPTLLASMFHAFKDIFID